MVKSKLARRTLLPRDIWKLKGMITFGIDGSIYREKNQRHVGPISARFSRLYRSSSDRNANMDYQGMTFIPQLNFLNSSPKGKHQIRDNAAYQPATLLMDELKTG